MRIFISYSSKDTRFKDELKSALSPLKEVGVDVWDDHLLGPGTRWEKAIQQALERADVVILLVSTDSLSSRWCRQEVQIAGNRLLPILARPTDFAPYSWLSRREVWPPKNARGCRRALSQMNKPFRDEFYAHLSKSITTRPQYDSEAPSGEDLVTEEMCERFARYQASVYDRGNKDDVLRKLLQACIKLSNQRRHDFAVLTAKAFRSALRIEENQIFASHRDILDLLEAGLPVNPVHLADLSSLDLGSLMNNPGYASVLRGIRLSETDYERAEKELDKVGKIWPVLSHCPLRMYAIGQARRKREKLIPAKTMLNFGLRLISPTRQCQWCNVRCKNAPLLVELHRGLGTVERNLGNEEEKSGNLLVAERCFQDAITHFEEAERSFNEDVSDNVKSDVFYSHAYFLFTRAIKERRTDSPPGARTRHLRKLRQAKRLFEESSRLRPHWAAPRARLQIVKQLLGKVDTDGYLDAREVAKTEMGPESHLTAFICGFAVLMHSSADSGLNPSGLCQELRDILQNTFVAKGPLACHAFDNTAIIDGRPVTDARLQSIDELLQLAATWPSDNLEEQRTHLRQALRLLRVE